MYPLSATIGSTENEATKSASQAYQGATLSRSSIRPNAPARPARRSPWRATHSSWPIAGPALLPSCPGSTPGVRSLMGSDLGDAGPAEQPARAEQHEHDQDHEDREVGPRRRPVARDVGLAEAEDQAAGHG